MLGQLDEARRCLQEKRFQDSFSLIKEYWLEHPDDAAAVRLLAQLTRELSHKDLSESLEQLCGDDGVKNDAKLLFDAGYRLIDTRQFELATMVLKKCAAIAPDEPTLNYELGFVLMLQGKFVEAIPYLEKSFAYETSFDTALNLCACFAACRRINDARGLIPHLCHLAKSEEEQSAVVQQEITLKRLEHFVGQSDLDTRDWTYILYGGILLERRQISAEPEMEEHEAIARIILVLKQFLIENYPELKIIEYFNLKARPLAECLGKIMNLPVQNYKGPGQAGKVLLMLANGSDIIGPHRTFVPLSEERSLFVYSLGTQSLPLMSEITGVLTTVQLPWDNENQLTDIQASVEKLSGAIKSLEHDSEIKSDAQSIGQYYQRKRSHLLLRNSKTFPERPPYTAEIPWA